MMRANRRTLRARRRSRTRISARFALAARLCAASATIALVLTLAATGCAAFSRIEGRFRDERSGLEMDLPNGWLRQNKARPDFVITRDGLRLEKVKISAVDVDHELKDTKRVYRADMTPYELAELSLSLVGADADIRDLRVTRIDAARIAEQPGFVADAAFVDPAGLAMRLRLYGAILPAKANGAKARVVQVQYAAPATEYYDRFLPAVEQLAAGARIANR